LAEQLGACIIDNNSQLTAGYMIVQLSRTVS